jgi:hypothetical protein
MKIFDNDNDQKSFCILWNTCKELPVTKIIQSKKWHCHLFKKFYNGIVSEDVPTSVGDLILANVVVLSNM